MSQYLFTFLIAVVPVNGLEVRVSGTGSGLGVLQPFVVRPQRHELRPHLGDGLSQRLELVSR